MKWANALLKDGKIMFWWTGCKCESAYDFYKDFLYAGLNMTKELETGRYSLVNKRISDFGKEEEDFYRHFLIHEDFFGNRPY